MDTIQVHVDRLESSNQNWTMFNIIIFICCQYKYAHRDTCSMFGFADAHIQTHVLAAATATVGTGCTQQPLSLSIEGQTILGLRRSYE